MLSWIVVVVVLDAQPVRAATTAAIDRNVAFLALCFMGENLSSMLGSGNEESIFSSGRVDEVNT
jgi:hypothetical protein